MKIYNLNYLCIPDECSPNPHAIEELKRIISNEPILREALSSILAVCGGCRGTESLLLTISEIAEKALEETGGKR